MNRLQLNHRLYCLHSTTFTYFLIFNNNPIAALMSELINRLFFVTETPPLRTELNICFNKQLLSDLPCKAVDHCLKVI